MINILFNKCCGGAVVKYPGFGRFPEIVKENYPISPGLCLAGEFVQVKDATVQANEIKSCIVE